jgi:SNF family Na+-dependent transporter
MAEKEKESWNSRAGVILAVVGSAVGLGNFLRFPGKAVLNGGGLFMIPYVIAFLIVGIPLAWSEWALGRHGGNRGHNSAPGIFREVLGGTHGSFLGMLGTIMPMLIYTYYVILEALCLFFAWSFLTGAIPELGADAGRITSFVVESLGMASNGAMFTGPQLGMLVFIALCTLINFALIYRGLSKGIETFCSIAMPLLVVCALVVLVRVLTLPPNPAAPEQNLINGLGFMWNPVAEGRTLADTLTNPTVWVEATGQIFFSLSLGFGLILTYASYLKKDDDICLSSLTSAAGNGFCEVVLGGMIAIPAAFIFLGPAFLSNSANVGTFSLGFMTLPNVFNQMPAGAFFGFLFFFLLFLAAVTSSLSMLQPSIALLEEGLGLSRKRSVALLGGITLLGTAFITWYSKGLTALDTVDFWMANFFIFIFATLQTVIFGWVVGKTRGYEELSSGAEIRVPRWIMFVIRYISPVYLIGIFALWAREEMPGRIESLKLVDGKPTVSLLSLVFILVVIAFFSWVVVTSNKRWQSQDSKKEIV